MEEKKGRYFQDQKKKDEQERKKSILYLILNYLKDNNLSTSYEALRREAQLTDQFVLCDNIDLNVILQEYKSYYTMKFQKEPRIVRRNDVAEQQLTNVKRAQRAESIEKTTLVSPEQTKASRPSVASSKERRESRGGSIEKDFQFEIVPIDTEDRPPQAAGSRVRNSLIPDQEKERLADFSGYTPEWREMADIILREYVPNDLGYSWNDCVGFDKPIELLKEATIYPTLYPQLFQNIKSTWNGVLFYGPPGSGKTLLAKALASEANTGFINVTSSTFVSKWRGESEKMIRVTFDLAKFYAPTIIFIDEIDALLSETKETNHEASCRFKSELLTQMDGLVSSNENVFILATTNNPWKLDKALLRRFEKRIFIPLPSDEAKIEIMRRNLKWKNDNKNDTSNLLQLTENFSGSDLKNVCKEVEMQIVREQIKYLNQKKKIGVRRAPDLNDLIIAIKAMRPTINIEYYDKLLKWHEQYGSH